MATIIELTADYFIGSQKFQRLLLFTATITDVDMKWAAMGLFTKALLG